MESEAKCRAKRRRDHDRREPRRRGLLALLSRRGLARAKIRKSATVVDALCPARQRQRFLRAEARGAPDQRHAQLLLRRRGRTPRQGARGTRARVADRYLHSDRKGRNSLVWDAIEPLRPAIDAKVFAYIARREFVRSDFVQTGASVFRLSRDVVRDLLHDASLSFDQIGDAADFMLKTLEKHAGREYRLFRA